MLEVARVLVAGLGVGVLGPLERVAVPSLAVEERPDLEVPSLAGVEHPDPRPRCARRLRVSAQTLLQKVSTKTHLTQRDRYFEAQEKTHRYSWSTSYAFADSMPGPGYTKPGKDAEFRRIMNCDANQPSKARGYNQGVAKPREQNLRDHIECVSLPHAQLLLSCMQSSARSLSGTYS